MNKTFSKSILFLLAFLIGIAMAFAGHTLAALILVSAVGSALAFNRQPGLCYANTLTNLIPDCYAALDVISRELVGFIPAVMRDSSAERVALNQTLRIPQTPANAAGKDITPAMAIPAAADQTIANKTFTISKQRAFPFSWTGEEQKSVNTGPGYLTLRQGQIANALRAACNEIELALALLAYKNASRATGTAGTTPFATTLTDTAQLRKILDDNGAPSSDRHCIIGTTSGAAIRTLTQLTKANEAADSTLLRQGTLMDIHGFALRESAQVASVTKGTGASYTSDTAGYAIGATSITLITGTGTVLAGDVVTFTGDTNKYVVATGVAAPGVIVLAAPGLQKALAASAVAMTIGGSFAANVGFTRNSILLGTRLPAVPEEGDMAIAREVITDDRSGLSFEIAIYPGYRMMLYEVGIAYGLASIKPEHSAILLG